MIRRDHQDVTRAHFCHKAGQPVIELGGGGGVARNVAAVAVEHIKVDEVDEGQTLKIAVRQLQRDLQTLGVAGGADGFADALARKDVVNLADTDGLLACGQDGVEHRVVRRDQTVVMTARCAGEVGGAVAHERAGNDAAHAVFAGQQLPRLCADLVQLFHRDDGLVRSDLEHTVGGGVDDECAGFHVLLAVVADDVGAGIGLVAQNLIAGFGGERIQQLLRETVREGGQRFGTQQTRDFPVADGRILAGTGFTQAGIAADGGGCGGAAGHAVQIEHAEPGKVITPEIGMPCNGPQRVGADIAEKGRVRLCSDAEAVEHNQKYTFCHDASPI